MPTTEFETSALVASFDDHLQAQAAVDALADRGFPIEHLSIVASDISFVEQVTGRANAATAVVSAAPSGAIAGALLGFFFGLFDWMDPLISGLALAVLGALVGLVIGALVGLLGHALERRRGFTSVGGLRAGRYDLLAPPELAGEARSLLERASPPDADG